MARTMFLSCMLTSASPSKGSYPSFGHPKFGTGIAYVFYSTPTQCIIVYRGQLIMILAMVFKDPRLKDPREKCVICEKRATHWKQLDQYTELIPCCKRCYSNSDITDRDWLNAKIWHARTKSGVQGEKCYLCGKPIIAFVETALDETFARQDSDRPEDWVENIQPVCDDHIMPEERNEFLAKSRAESF